MPSPSVSVILPIYNEEENIPLVYAELKTALEDLHRSYEMIFVDDGSSDGSAWRLQQIALDDPTVMVIRFRRNHGQTAAISAGIDGSSGTIIVLMDADMQNDPRDIGALLAKMEEGYDVVSGWRKDRHDAFVTRTLPSKAANALISTVTGVHLHDYGCTLKAYRREVLEPVRLYGEMHRFIPAYASWNGARITEMPVNHRARQFGKSKYGLSRTVRVVLDLITVKFLGSYGTKPLYAFGTVGVGLGMLSFLIVLVALIESFVPPYVRLHNNPLTLLGAIVFVLSVQVLLMGLLAELTMRTYYESQGKSTYTIRSITRSTADSGAEPAVVKTSIPGRPLTISYYLASQHAESVAAGMARGSTQNGTSE